MTPAKPAPPPGDVADAINALTTFLRNGSHTPDPEAFNPRQRDIQRDFAELLTGLGRGARPGLLVDPVLFDGHLQLGAALPARADSVVGRGRRRRQIWAVSVAEAAGPPGTPNHLQHQSIKADGVARIWVYDAAGRLILIGFPKPPKTTT
jgi:hypothetical protein